MMKFISNAYFQVQIYQQFTQTHTTHIVRGGRNSLPSWQGYLIWHPIGIDWHQMGQMWEIFQYIFSHTELILKDLQVFKMMDLWVGDA